MGDKREQNIFDANFFHYAVRDLKPVYILEELHKIEVFSWEDNIHQRIYSPSEALLYAIKYDHRTYAHHLLYHFSDVALTTSGVSNGCCPPNALHLTAAVCYDRKAILSIILQTVHRLPALRSYMNRGDCIHLEEGKTPLHKACELSQTDTVMMLLGNGASPLVEDHDGMTPLDLILKQLWNAKSENVAKTTCIEILLKFLPKMRFKIKSSLEKDPQRWVEILGEENFNYLAGRTPGTLFHISTQSILSRLPHHDFPKCLDKLPIPTSLITA